MSRFLFVVLASLCLIDCVYAKNIKNSKFKIYHSDNLQCGGVLLKVISKCYDPEEGLLDRGSAGITRTCRYSNLEINQKVIALPLVPKENINYLSQRGMNHKGDLMDGTWSLVSLTCAENNKIKAIILNQATSNNINSMDHGKGSLWDEPAIIDLKGNIYSKTQRDKINKLLEDKKLKIKSIEANAVYGVEK